MQHFRPEREPKPEELAAIPGDVCAKCKYWQTHGYTVGHVVESMGECRRFPPVIAREDCNRDACGAVWGTFPSTAADEWCGEFQGRSA